MYRFTPIPYHQVSIQDAFWSERMRVNQEQSLLKQYDHCKRTGRIDALRLEWKPGSDLPKPHQYWDSDTAKWLEAACSACRLKPNAELREKIDEVATLFVSAQQADGYLNSYYTTVKPKPRWSDLLDDHELYCAGHIIEAAVAHYELTGTSSLLDTACRLADCIDRKFGRGEGQLQGYPGHQELELALVKLYKATGVARYLDLAEFFLDERGKEPLWFEKERPGLTIPWQGRERIQIHKPVREQDEAVGHAVRAIYQYIGMIDVASETGDESLRCACERLWDSVTTRKMYITGGIGSSWCDEAFSPEYDLPNQRAYCETCASVALAFWAGRMLQLEGKARYAEIIERVIYNSALSGMSLDGRKFFYQNPLASLGDHTRKEWFKTSCCPSNLSRLLGTLGGKIASVAEDSLAIHLYIGAEVPFSLPNGLVGKVVLSGDMPWGGAVKLSVRLEHAVSGESTLRLRMPSWSQDYRVSVNGREVEFKVEDGYAPIRRVWQNGDALDISFDLPVRQLIARDKVVAAAGHIALQRGPFIYCIEDADFPDAGGVLPIVLSAGHAAQLRPIVRNELLGGIVALEGTSQCVQIDDTEHRTALYRVAGQETLQQVNFRAIPYFAWDNRAQGAMRVWIPRSV